mmetsp:Transcript_6897/g.15987  ORF Transcript_6897/g.15987 Transcript_6897/m.15987 type:complete len:445 (+) Transcript_6897:72-1406(+)
MREALVNCGQAPHSAIFGCADSRAPIDTLFDAMPGDLFVLRNAGNTCTHAEGSMVGSLEFCVTKLGTRLILVLGHTHCGAVAGAARTFLEGHPAGGAGSALEGLLMDLTAVADQASRELGPGVELDHLAAHAVKVNVFHSVDFLLKYSETLREYVENEKLEIQGAIYHLASGRVEFLGQSPRQAELLASGQALPPSMAALPIRTTGDGPLEPEQALQLLKEGNERFAVGKPLAGKISADMRKMLLKQGQAPHTAIVGCADSRAPLETIFDAMPGDLFVLRNAGNSCTHAEGSIMGSLEFCTGALQTKLILILGHTQCQAVAKAVEAHRQSDTGGSGTYCAGKASEALVEGLAACAAAAALELGEKASTESLTEVALKWNVFRTIHLLLQYSTLIRDQVQRGDVVVQGAVFDAATGQVNFLGCPEAILSGGSSAWEACVPQWAGA